MKLSSVPSSDLKKPFVRCTMPITGRSFRLEAGKASCFCAFFRPRLFRTGLIFRAGFIIRFCIGGFF